MPCVAGKHFIDRTSGMVAALANFDRIMTSDARKDAGALPRKW